MSAFGQLPAFKQAEFRSVKIYRDNHNRPYEVVVDSRDPSLTWVSIPIPKYRVPDKRMYPPPAFLKSVTEEMGRIKIEYDGWLALTIQNEEEYDTSLLKICQANNPNNALELFKNPTREILRLAGARPMPSDLVRAMRAGNAWSLGFKPANEYPPFVNDGIRQWISKGDTVRTKVRNRDDDTRFLIEDTERYLDYEEQHDPEALGGKKRRPSKAGRGAGTVEYTEFVKLKTREGLSLKEIGPLWRKEKAERAALAAAGE